MTDREESILSDFIMWAHQGRDLGEIPATTAIIAVRAAMMHPEWAHALISAYHAVDDEAADALTVAAEELIAAVRMELIA